MESEERGTAADPGERLSPSEAGRLLGVSARTVQRWIDAGGIPAFKTLGGHRRILRDDLLSFARRHAIPVPPAETGSGTRATETVLLVDDEPDFLKTMEARLRAIRPGLRVLTAGSGFLAGVLVERHAPALVLLDLRMPDLDGIEVCRAIKGNPATAGTVVVGLTGTRDPAAWRALEEAGARRVLLKPAGKREIESLLEEVFAAPRP